MVAGNRVVQDQIRHMMVPRMVVAHLSCVSVQGLAEVCDLFALVVGLRFCMLLAQAVVPAEMPGVGFPGQVNVTFLLLGQHCARVNHHLAEQVAAATGHTSDDLVSAGVVCWKHSLEGSAILPECRTFTSSLVVYARFLISHDTGCRHQI